ncbi:MAG TPA: ABC transporter ATP-binding protein [Dehalococcoidia bacterium]|nr:ABC transporter ATP-binding protein [Dehalococcoidia bacterium]
MLAVDWAAVRTEAQAAPAARSLAIDAEGLVKRYGDKLAVDGVSLKVRRGEVFGLLGPNGAGKTTTIEMITGLREPDAGQISVLGIDARRRLDDVKQRIGVQLQTPALFPLLKVYEVLDLFASFFEHADEPDALIAALDLEESRSKLTKELSGGQQQRLSVALALINRPDLVFLDEPTTGLDPQARIALWDVIERQRAAGRTILLTTHYMEEAERLCDRVAIIDHGVIQAVDAPRELIRQNFSETAIIFSLPQLSLEELRALPAVSNAGRDGDEVTLYSHAVAETMAALLAWAGAHGRPLDSLYVRGATLEDVFLKLTGRRLRE